MTKTTLQDRINKLAGTIDQAAGKTEVTIQDVTGAPNLQAFKKAPLKTQHQQYRSLKLKTETYQRLQSIIELHRLDSIGRVIDRIVSDWCDQVEGHS